MLTDLKISMNFSNMVSIDNTRFTQALFVGTDIARSRIDSLV